MMRMVQLPIDAIERERETHTHGLLRFTAKGGTNYYSRIYVIQLFVLVLVRFIYMFICVTITLKKRKSASLFFILLLLLYCKTFTNIIVDGCPY